MKAHYLVVAKDLHQAREWLRAQGDARISMVNMMAENAVQITKVIVATPNDNYVRSSDFVDVYFLPDVPNELRPQYVLRKRL